MKLLLALVISLAFASTCVDQNAKLLYSYVVSDTNNWVSGPSITVGGKAVATRGNSGWTANIPGAIWIWDSLDPTIPSATQVCVFMNEFYIPGTPRSVVLDIAGDNHIRIWVNGANIGYDKPNGSYSSSSQQKANITPFVVSGLNVIQIEVTNIGVSGISPGAGINPAGTMYKISIASAVI